MPLRVVSSVIHARMVHRPTGTGRASISRPADDQLKSPRRATAPATRCTARSRSCESRCRSNRPAAGAECRCCAGGQRPHRAAAKAQRVFHKVVVVEHAPGPADHGVGVDVRAGSRARTRAARRRARASIAAQVVDAEGVGRAHRGHDRRDPLARRPAPRGPRRPAPARRSNCPGAWARASTLSWPMPSQLATFRQRVVALLAGQHDGVLRQARLAGSRARPFPGRS